jgi:hypothetical protein
VIWILGLNMIGCLIGFLVENETGWAILASTFAYLVFSEERPV